MNTDIFSEDIIYEQDERDEDLENELYNVNKSNITFDLDCLNNSLSAKGDHSKVAHLSSEDDYFLDLSK